MSGSQPVLCAKTGSFQENWLVPGQWLEIYKTNPAAKRIEQNSEVLQRLAELKKREEARQQPQYWIKSQQADIIFACVIIAYGLLTGVDVEVTVNAWPGPVSKQYETVMLALQTVFVIIFLVELVLRVRAEGVSYCLPFTVGLRRPAPGEPRRLVCERCNPAGFLDTAIIVFGTAELSITLFGLEVGSLSAAGPVRMLRLVRLVRIMKGLLVFDELKLLCAGMLSSLSAVIWAFALLAVLMYLGSLFCVILLGKNLALSQYFGGVGQALFTHFMIVTLEAWPDIADDVIDNSSPVWGIYFMIFICVSSLALMNLVTGVVCEKLLNISQGDTDDEHPNQLDAFREDRERFRSKLAEIFLACDLDESATINCEEFGLMMQSPGMRQLFKLMEAQVSASSDHVELFRMLDLHDRGSLSFEELSTSLLRLRGSCRRIHSLMLQRDVVRRHQREARRLSEMEENLLERTRAELSAVEDAVSAKLESLQRGMLPYTEASAFSEAGASPRKLADGMEEATCKLVEEEPPPLLKQLDGMEEATWNLLKAELPDGYKSLVQGSLAPAQELEPLKASEPHAVEGPTAPVQRKPWMKEAGARLETLIGELDTLHDWATGLLVTDLESCTAGGGADAKIQENAPP